MPRSFILYDYALGSSSLSLDSFYAYYDALVWDGTLYVGTMCVLPITCLNGAVNIVCFVFYMDVEQHPYVVCFSKQMATCAR